MLLSLKFNRKLDDSQFSNHHPCKNNRLSDPSEMETYFLYQVGGSSRPVDLFQIDYSSGNYSSSSVISESDSDNSDFVFNEKRVQKFDYSNEKKEGSKEYQSRKPPITPCPKEIIQVKSAPKSNSILKYDIGVKESQQNGYFSKKEDQFILNENVGNEHKKNCQILNISETYPKHFDENNQQKEYSTFKGRKQNEAIKLLDVFQFSDKSGPNDLSENLMFNASLESQIKASEMDPKPIEILDFKRKKPDGLMAGNNCRIDCKTWIGGTSPTMAANVQSYQVKYSAFFTTLKKYEFQNSLESFMW
jgi:hypothetical protein